jgi:hypothetical protein
MVVTFVGMYRSLFFLHHQPRTTTTTGLSAAALSYLDQADEHMKKVMQTKGKMSYGYSQTPAALAQAEAINTDIILDLPRELAPLLHNDLSDSLYYSAIRQALLISCGSLCARAETSRTPGKFFDAVRKPIQCPSLFSAPIFDSPAVRWPPPPLIPAVLYDDYTLEGAADVESMVFLNRYSGTTAYHSVWTREAIEKMREEAFNHRLAGGYKVWETENIRAGLDSIDTVKGGHILVIGSEVPWLEALLLAAGAALVTTLEYGAIESQHPQVRTLLPHEFKADMAFDGVVSFSSLEHAGLGRYGDLLNPWGDIIAVAKAWCVTKPGGFLLLGLMGNGVDRQKDTVTWNAARKYGPRRWAELAVNWDQVGEVQSDREGHQLIYTFKKLPAS